MLREDGQTGDYDPIVIMFISLIRNTGVMRLGFAILIFLLIGAILNIAVAWACTLWSPFSSRSLLTDFSDIRASIRGVPENLFVVTSRESGFGVIRFTFTWHIPGEPNAIWYIQAGWPFVALSGQISVDGEIVGALNTPRWLFAKVDSPARRLLPINPHAIGIAINSAFWALLLAAITLGPSWLRRLHRLRSDRCVNCGYDLCGAAHDRCPECGVRVQAASANVSSNSPDNHQVE